MVPVKPQVQHSNRGELRGQLGFICDIEIIESIVSITTPVVNSCDNISALKRATIHPEAVKSRWKQVDLISSIYDVYHSMGSGISLVHIPGHQNSGRPVSTLTPLAYLNIILDALA